MFISFANGTWCTIIARSAEGSVEPAKSSPNINISTMKYLNELTTQIITKLIILPMKIIICF